MKELTYEEVSEATIQDRLWFEFSSNGYRYKFFNTYIFSWESDFYCQSRAGYSIDVEIKISLQDYKNDFDKIRHKVIKERLNGARAGFTCPNRFYFAVPDYLHNEIIRKRGVGLPEYAGLMVLERNGLKCEKKAPVIHKNKYDVTNKVADKLWWDYESRMVKKVLSRRVSLND
ncbi:hypothetical protein [Gracilimonas sediminicola]|uniref:Uncharacterized protein n=1 Tax=Gracilimonas sediminicola TaxID=2952158 RepID=A0A9X2REZ0_9BACT|nr:hypothetical protein [Gracilimonas sediminicola]MCP9290024.1 hypothetical protein [Gracilimonas sediminicola]